MSETNGDNRPLRPAGYYQSESGAIVYLNANPEIGTPQIDAYVQAGFKFIGTELPESDDVSQPSRDGYTSYTDSKGVTRYQLNGKFISKDEYELHN